LPRVLQLRIEPFFRPLSADKMWRADGILLCTQPTLHVRTRDGLQPRPPTPGASLTAFVRGAVAGNHMRPLRCLLAQAGTPFIRGDW